jgi:hypothetical protein
MPHTSLKNAYSFQNNNVNSKNLHKSLLKTDIHWDLQKTSCKFYTWLIEGLILNFQRNYRETKKATQIRQTNWHLAPLWYMKLLHNTHPAWHPTVRPCCTQIWKAACLLVVYESLYILISGFHRELLYLVTFIVRLMHSVMQNLEVKIYVV